MASKATVQSSRFQKAAKEGRKSTGVQSGSSLCPKNDVLIHPSSRLRASALARSGCRPPSTGLRVARSALSKHLHHVQHAFHRTEVADVAQHRRPLRRVVGERPGLVLGQNGTGRQIVHVDVDGHWKLGHRIVFQTLRDRSHRVAGIDGMGDHRLERRVLAQQGAVRAGRVVITGTGGPSRRSRPLTAALAWNGIVDIDRFSRWAFATSTILLVNTNS